MKIIDESAINVSALLSEIEDLRKEINDKDNLIRQMQSALKLRNYQNQNH